MTVFRRQLTPDSTWTPGHSIYIYYTMARHAKIRRSRDQRDFRASETPGSPLLTGTLSAISGVVCLTRGTRCMAKPRLSHSRHSVGLYC